MAMTLTYTYTCKALVLEGLSCKKLKVIGRPKQQTPAPEKAGNSPKPPPEDFSAVVVIDGNLVDVTFDTSEDWRGTLTIKGNPDKPQDANITIYVHASAELTTTNVVPLVTNGLNGESEVSFKAVADVTIRPTDKK